MQIPGPTHPGWKRVISGEIKPVFEYLAIKILLVRLNLAYTSDASPASVQKSIEELRTFFEKNITIPKVQSDLKKIIG